MLRGQRLRGRTRPGQMPRGRRRHGPTRPPKTQPKATRQARSPRCPRATSPICRAIRRLPCRRRSFLRFRNTPATGRPGTSLGARPFRLEAGGEQPLLDGGSHADEQRQVTLVLSEPRLSRGKVARKPLAVAPGNHQVLSALNDEHRRGDVFELELPRSHEREIVVDPAVDASREATTEAVEHVCAELAVKRLGVEVREEWPHRLDETRHLEAVDAGDLMLQMGTQRFLTLSCQAELDDVPLAHAVGQVEVGPVWRTNGGHRCDRHNPIRKARRRGESVRTTTGKAPGRKALEREGICNPLNISDDVEDRTAGVASRVAVAGTVVRDEADTVLERERDVRVEWLAGGRRAVVVEDRTAVGGACVVHRDRTAVRRGDGELVHRASRRRTRVLTFGDANLSDLWLPR